MNNFYEKKLTQLDSLYVQIEEKELDIKSQKLYTRLDIEELNQRWTMKLVLAVSLTIIIVTFIYSLAR